MGIAPEFQDRIWSLFQTLEARDKVESTGIGLAVVREMSSRVVDAPGSNPSRARPSGSVGLNGIEILRELRKDPKLRAITVIVLTTSNAERDRIEAFKLNVAGYVLKPVTFGQFAEVRSTSTGA